MVDVNYEASVSPEITELVTKIRDQAEELQGLYDDMKARDIASMEAITQWQIANKRVFMWPNHKDLCAFLMLHLDILRGAIAPFNGNAVAWCANCGAPMQRIPPGKWLCGYCEERSLILALLKEILPMAVRAVQTASDIETHIDPSSDGQRAYSAHADVEYEIVQKATKLLISLGENLRDE